MKMNKRSKRIPQEQKLLKRKGNEKQVKSNAEKKGETHHETPRYV
jgi:hypothetical protein